MEPVRPSSPPKATRLHHILDRAHSLAPDAIAISDAEGVWTYAELAKVSGDQAAALSKIGVRPGDRVLFEASSSKHTVSLIYAISQIGAISVPVNTESPSFMVHKIGLDSSPVIAITEFPSSRFSSLRVPAFDLGSLHTIALEVDQLARRGSEPQIVETAMLLYTSGSTAGAKGIVCPHSSMIFALSAIQEVLKYTSADVVYCRLPLSWDVGIYEALAAGLSLAHLVLANAGRGPDLIKEISDCGATIVPIVPTLGGMLADLAARSSRTLDVVRMVTTTGERMPPSLAGRLAKLFPSATLVRQFGLTECKRVSIVPPDSSHPHAEAGGLPLPGTRILIADDSGEPVPTEATGQLLVNGPHVMEGYWNDVDLTAATFRRNQSGEIWLWTGDFGRVDEAGYFYFHGRRDDIFKRFGVRASTLEVEVAALEIPGVAQAAAFAPSDGFDLRLAVEASIDPRELRRDLAARLDRARRPALILACEVLPRTNRGKLDRRAIIDLFEDPPAESRIAR